MISGYYTSIDSQDIQNILVKRIERLLKILLSASSIYLLKDLVFLAIHHQSVSLYLVEEFSAYRILKMLIFDDSLIRQHLWFIVAMIYLYFVLILSDKYGVLNRIVQFQMPLITILFIANLLIGETPHLIGHDTPVCFLEIG